MRLIVRRVGSTRRHLKKLTAFEKKTGWRHCSTATNIRHMWGITGSATVSSRGRVLAANLASDLDAWVRLLTPHHLKGQSDIELVTMRFRLYHPPASPTTPGGASMSFVKAPLSGLGWFGLVVVMRRARASWVYGIRRRCRRGAWRTGR